MCAYIIQVADEAMIWWIDGQEVGRHTKGVDVLVEDWDLTDADDGVRNRRETGNRSRQGFTTRALKSDAESASLEAMIQSAWRSFRRPRRERPPARPRGTRTVVRMAA